MVRQLLLCLFTLWGFMLVISPLWRGAPGAEGGAYGFGQFLAWALGFLMVYAGVRALRKDRTPERVVSPVLKVAPVRAEKVGESIAPPGS